MPMIKRASAAIVCVCIAVNSPIRYTAGIASALEVIGSPR